MLEIPCTVKASPRPSAFYLKITISRDHTLLLLATLLHMVICRKTPLFLPRMVPSQQGGGW